MEISENNYKVTVIMWKGYSKEFNVSGTFQAFDKYYRIRDKKGLENYFPIKNTIIQQVE